MAGIKTLPASHTAGNAVSQLHQHWGQPLTNIAIRSCDQYMHNLFYSVLLKSFYGGFIKNGTIHWRYSKLFIEVPDRDIQYARKTYPRKVWPLQIGCLT